jgi:hypothetical protein
MKPVRLPARVATAALAALLLVPAVAAAKPSPTATASGSPKSGSTSSSPSRTSGKATFGIGPASAKGIDGRPYLNYLAGPGSTLDDRIAVVNLAPQKLTLSLYVVDATVGLDGSFGYLPRSAARTDAATWIRPGVGAATITLGPRQTKIVRIAIDVPKNATPGDHAAGIIASLTSRVQGPTSKVNFEQRVGLKALVRVSGPLHAQLQVERLSAKYSGPANPVGSGTVAVRYRVHNVGNVRLGARQKLTVSGLVGSTAGPKLADVPLLLPGTSYDVSTTVHGVFPEFTMTARVTLQPLVLAGDVDPHLPKSYSASTRFWAVPWSLAAAIIGVLLLAGLGWYERRRRHRRGGGGDVTDGPDPGGDFTDGPDAGGPRGSGSPSPTGGRDEQPVGARS